MFYWINVEQDTRTPLYGGNVGASVAYRDRPFPKIVIKKVKDDDMIKDINISIGKITDLSF